MTLFCSPLTDLLHIFADCKVKFGANLHFSFLNMKNAGRNLDASMAAYCYVFKGVCFSKCKKAGGKIFKMLPKTCLFNFAPHDLSLLTTV